MTDLTREQIELIKRNAQQSICVENGETLSALCDMALRAAKQKHPVDYSWVCNECGSYEFTMAVSEDDLSALACSGCGCDEFHKEEFKHD